MPITKLEQILETVKSRPRKRLVAAWANDSHTVAAVGEAVGLGLIEATLVGDEPAIRAVCQAEKLDPAKFTIVQESSDTKAAARAVAMVNAGEAQILMKGLVSSDKYMRAILDKEKGLMDPGAILSHVTVIEVASYPKLIVCGDVAVLPAPDLKEKIALTNYYIATAHALGIEKPKVALIAATEQMSYKMPACVDAAIISKMADRGGIRGALVDGPLALDVAVDPEAVEIKGLKSPVAGDADVLVFPSIEAGNVFYKTCTKLAGAELAGLVVGARVPCVLTSRGDTAKSKLYSIGLAALMAK
jgi:phosphate butyryltransferase